MSTQDRTDNTSDFDWYSDDDSIVVRQQEAIAVYTNPYGDVVIRQKGDWNDEHSPWFVVAADRAPLIVEAMLRAAGIGVQAPDRRRSTTPPPSEARSEQRDVRDPGDGQLPLFADEKP